MSVRARLFVTLAAAALVPLVVLALGVRREMARRLEAAEQRRVAALLEGLRDDLARTDADVGARLAALAARLADDNRFRLAAVRGDPAERRYLLDYAGAALPASGLVFLWIQDADGRILSSGHFRNEYDRLEPGVAELIAAQEGGTVLLRARTPEGTRLALARADAVTLAGRTFTLVGGADPGPVATGRIGGGDLTAALALPGGATALTPPGGATPVATRVVATIALPFLDLTREPPASLDTGRLVVTRSTATLDALRRSIDAWFLAAGGVTVFGALAVAAWLSSRASRPIRELAGKTAQLDLDRLDVDFTTERDDEIGALARLLGDLTARLRQSAARLREIERRAAVGELARQVNHDIKNGLTPIRHVLRHLAQVARDDPEALPRIFEERRGTLESSLDYLETLARNYARLSPQSEPRPCDLNRLVEEALRGAAGRGGVRFAPTPDLPPVTVDPVAIRRVLENLVSNALDSLDGRADGVVTVRTEPPTADRPTVRVIVADTGRGMTREELDRAFDDFHTTKPGGTGLGLSIVRRLLQDQGAGLRVETAPGLGSTFSVELPLAKPSVGEPNAPQPLTPNPQSPTHAPDPRRR